MKVTRPKLSWWERTYFPAILKGWIERVFTLDFAFGLSPEAWRGDLDGRIPLLKHEKALALRPEEGLTPTGVFSTLQVYLGSQYVNDFNYLGRTYQVRVQGSEAWAEKVGGLVDETMKEIQKGTRLSDTTKLAILAALIYFKRHPELPAWETADLSAPAIALGQAIGRIGCFMAGDDYGRPTDLPWAVAFHHPDAADIGGAPLGIRLHPVQLYESLICLLLFFFLVRLARHKKFDGEIILAYSSLYALARYFLEFLRGDVDRGFVLGGLLSTSQVIAVIALIICIPLFVRRKRA